MIKRVITPGVQGWFNILKNQSINVIHHINKLEKKIFDYLNKCRQSIWIHSLMVRTLSTMGIVGNFHTLIKCIYKKTK